MTPLHRRVPPRTLRVLGAFVAFGLLAGAVPIVLAHSFEPVPGLPHRDVAPPQQWSSGTSSWSNTSQTTFNASYQIDSYYDYALAFTATNASATTVQIETVVTSISNFSEQGCSPNCATPHAGFQTSDSASSVETIFENFTRSAQVEVNGSAFPALGVLDAQEYLTAHSAEFASGTGPGGTNLSGSVVGVGSGANDFVFSQPFGLVPWNMTPAGDWNGTGPFNETSQFQQNYTVSGIFTNLTGIMGTGGTGSPFRPMLAYPGNGSTGGYGGGPSLPPVGIGIGFWGGLVTFCPGQNSSAGGPPGNGSGGFSTPWQNTSCSTSFGGTEYAMGSEYNFASYNGSFNGIGGPLVVAVSGPYVPGPALSEVIPGSALFGGAARGLGPVIAWQGFYGYGPGIGVPGSGPNSPPPLFTPPPLPGAPQPIAKTSRTDTAGSPAPSGTGMFGPSTLLLVGVGVLAGSLATALLLRRRGATPPPPGPR